MKINHSKNFPIYNTLVQSPSLASMVMEFLGLGVHTWNCDTAQWEWSIRLSGGERGKERG